MTRMPNFLIIGAAKGGTTSFYYYLSQHPQVYMSPAKEPRFFALENDTLDFQNPDKAINRDSITKLSDYQKLFEGVADEIAVGEASPLYLYSEKAVERIAHYIPDVKLVAILRNPVERAYSCYKHLIALEPLSFAEALREEDKRIKNNWAHLWHYRQAGYYYKQLSRYFEKFDKQQIKVYLFDDLCANPLKVTQDAFRFLGVDDSFIPDLSYKNVSNNPKVKTLQNLFNEPNSIRFIAKKIVPEPIRVGIANRVRGWNKKEFPAIPEEVRLQLAVDYKDDILKLQELIDRDLSRWMC